MLSVFLNRWFLSIAGVLLVLAMVGTILLWASGYQRGYPRPAPTPWQNAMCPFDLCDNPATGEYYLFPGYTLIWTPPPDPLTGAPREIAYYRLDSVEEPAGTLGVMHMTLRLGSQTYPVSLGTGPIPGLLNPRDPSSAVAIASVSKIHKANVMSGVHEPGWNINYVKIVIYDVPQSVVVTRQ